MTITLSPETEKTLREAAARQGTTPDELAEETLRARFGGAVGYVGPRGEELRAQVNAARGMFSHISGGSYEFMRNKVYEKLLEERHW